MTFTAGQHVRMLVTSQGDDANDVERLYPVGTTGVVIHVDDRGAYHVGVGPQNDDSIIIVIEPGDVEAQMELAPASTKLTASVVPWSSIVGTGVMLCDATGQVVAQLGLLNANIPREPEAMLAFAQRIATAINAGQPEHQVVHKNGRTYDVVADAAALFQVSINDPWPNLDPGRFIRDGQPVTVYRNPEGMHFVRFPDEVVSPRFEKVT